MYRVAIERHIDAAHFLRGYQGKCEALHGHRYRVIVKVEAGELNDIGLAYDFTVLKQHLDGIIARYDHTCLNDVPPFDSINPSSENIASTIYDELASKLAGDAASLSEVEVYESPDSWVTYSPG
ncbi:6-carboxytetrahydropterin synthase QueD [Chloroflexota bacterium]